MLSWSLQKNVRSRLGRAHLSTNASVKQTKRLKMSLQTIPGERYIVKSLSLLAET